MGERMDMALTARIFGVITIGIATMVCLAEIGNRYGAMAFSAALAVVGVMLLGVASFLGVPDAD